MGALLVVDGGDVCRAPIVAFTLRQQLAEAAAASAAEVVSRGLEPVAGSTMCGSAATRLGWSGSAIAFFGAHRATALTADDVADAELVLTAERAQRSSVVRLVPGSQAKVFTWKEAVVLATVVTERVADGLLESPRSLPVLARALHAARGTVPLIEPPVRTGVFHWRARPADPLSVADGHDGEAMHAHVTAESQRLALTFAARAADLVTGRAAPVERVPRLPVHGRRRRA